MFKKKENENEIDIKRAVEIAKNTKKCLIIANEECGFIQGEHYYVYQCAMNVIKQMLDEGLIDLNEIIENFAGCDGHIVKISASNKEEALKKIDKAVREMKKTISEKIEEEEE